ncbi:MAG TPA: hypothetical protein VKB87_23920 [Myxococcaceae bacterium]|nr:hypothetical protein [Myxococcaceae bacterium]
MRLGACACLLLLAAVALGCITYSYLPVTAPAPPRATQCTVQVFTKPPEQPYETLGVLDNDALSFAAVNGQEFLKAVRETVCRAGGDAVIATVEPTGKFTRGTVIRFREGADGGVSAR